ncbi:hypothetical protein ACF061_35765 [Streptomyces sp. NPDC015220]|uniref:hypothetical protein n=1 Tax=Streptomyces sp. NPDC015220 TaxID=3364947 RepID=UPI0036F8E0C6
MSGDERDGGSVRRPRPVGRPQLPPGPLRDLKHLLHDVYLAAGAPSLDTVADLVADDDDAPGAPGRDSVRRILWTSALPPSQADVASVAAALAREARWDPVDLEVRARDLWVRAWTARPLGTPVGDLNDPIALEVHAAIDAGSGTDAGDARLLPPYVVRAHDVRLAEAVARAVDGRSTLVVLVGGSSTGKTRACWEAVKSLPTGWRLWHPAEHPRPAAFLRDVERIGPRTVVWLNEIELYLRSERDGEHVAAALRKVLHDPHLAPVLVLGTVWPEHWQSLCAAAFADGACPRAEVSRLLTGHGIEVPDAFGEDDVPALAEAARGDARLAQALRDASERRFTQYLAGVPVLLERFHTAPAPGRALVHAAFALRSFGLGPVLPERLLTAVAPAFLSAAQWDEAHQEGAVDWPDGHLARLARPARGVPGPLAVVRPRPGEAEPTETHYRLADYLWQRASEYRAPLPAGEDALFGSVLNHATLEELASMAASTARQTAYYARLRRRGSPHADRALVWFTARLTRSWGWVWAGGKRAEAERAGSFWAAMCWAQVLAERDHEPDTLLDTLSTARVRGELSQALEWIDDAVAAGHPDGRLYLEAGARQLVYDERFDEAVVCYRRLGAPLDLPFSMWWLVSLLARRGDTETAYELLRPHLTARDPGSLRIAEELELPRPPEAPPADTET